MTEQLVVYPNSPLATSRDRVHFGITEEYAQSILDGALELINEIGGFPTGKLVFEIGAHSEAGSSKAIFFRATKALIEISQLDLINLSDEFLQKEIEAVL